jgi:hypothetical protein
MKKLSLLERPFYQPTYRIQNELNNARVLSRFSLLRDAPAHSEISPDTAWESFDIHSMPAYFNRGVGLLRENIDKLQDLAGIYSEADAKDLLFMTESLLQARHLLEEPHSSAGTAG